jgi:hypothetical protein
VTLDELIAELSKLRDAHGGGVRVKRSYWYTDPDGYDTESEADVTEVTYVPVRGSAAWPSYVKLG